MSRRFHLHRREDVSGISGTGVVAEGVEFGDGVVVVRWLKTATGRPEVKPSTVVHDDIESVIGLHGHNGATEVVWDDAPEKTDEELAAAGFEAVAAFEREHGPIPEEVMERIAARWPA